MPFKNVEEIERHYQDAIGKAGSNYAAATELKIEQAYAVASFRLAAIAERERTVWTRDALHAFPLAAEFADQVKGETEDEIRQSAQELHERLARLFQTHQQQKKRDELIAAQLAAESQQEEGSDVQQP